ncbi:MAG: hypothetical protein ACXACE_11515 [Candidatus Thorarchaeota archaeon]|jgi:hypothetical protein
MFEEVASNLVIAAWTGSTLFQVTKNPGMGWTITLDIVELYI